MLRETDAFKDTTRHVDTGHLLGTNGTTGTANRNTRGRFDAGEALLIDHPVAEIVGAVATIRMTAVARVRVTGVAHRMMENVACE